MSTPIFSNNKYDICGSCLHTVHSHTGYNGIGKFMYCGNCNKLCDIDEFKIKHNPSPYEKMIALMVAREYQAYNPKTNNNEDKVL